MDGAFNVAFKETPTISELLTQWGAAVNTVKSDVEFTADDNVAYHPEHVHVRKESDRSNIHNLES